MGLVLIVATLAGQQISCYLGAPHATQASTKKNGHRDQSVTCDVGDSLHSKIHPLFIKYSNSRSTQCYVYQYPSLFSLLYVPYSKNLLVSTPFYFFSTYCMLFTCSISFPHQLETERIEFPPVESLPLAPNAYCNNPPAHAL